MQRAHQVLSVLLDPLAVEAIRVTSADKVPQAVWARLGKDLQGRRGLQVLLPPLQVQQVIQGPSVPLDPQVPLVLMASVSQVLKAHGD